MPVYGYKCLQCGKSFSLLLSIAKKQEAACPACKSKDLKEDFRGYGCGSQSKTAISGGNFT